VEECEAPEGDEFNGMLDDVRIYKKALTEPEILGAMEGLVEAWPYASMPDPPDGALHEDTWVSLSWRPGGHAVLHKLENHNDSMDALDTMVKTTRLVTKY